MFDWRKRIVSKAGAIHDGWVLDRPGVEYSLVHVDKSQGLWVTKVRFQAGAKIPSHLHTGAVIGYTTRGAWGYPEDNVRFEVGDYCFEPPGTFHEIEVFGSKTEVTEAIFIMWGAILSFDIEDRQKVTGYSDANTIVDEYLDLCRDQNITPTEFIEM